MKIAIPGGTGQVGTLLARAFHKDGHEVIVLGRRAPTPASWRVEQWNPANVAEWADKVEGADVVINLAGRSVNCRYTAKNRQEILQSRVESVRAVGQAISSAKRAPRVWLQASTATIYSHTYTAPNDEVSGVIGGAEPDTPKSWRFSIEVATAWEKNASLVKRVVDSGADDLLLRPFSAAQLTSRIETHIQRRKGR